MVFGCSRANVVSVLNVTLLVAILVFVALHAGAPHPSLTTDPAKGSAHVQAAEAAQAKPPPERVGIGSPVASVEDEHRTVLPGLLNNRSGGFVKFSDCTAGASHVVVDPLRGIWLHGGSHEKQDEVGGAVAVPFCSIASRKPLMIDLAAPSSSPPLLSCKGTATLGIIERPQHAMQFLFSLMGIMAMQDELEIHPSTTHAHVAVMSYGLVGTYDDLMDRHRFPHIELLDLLSTKQVEIVFLPTLRSSIRPSPIRQQQHGREVALGAYGNASVYEQSARAARAQCYEYAAWGSLVVRLLHYKKQKRWYHMIRDKHLLSFRRRVIEHFNLTEAKNFSRRYALVVRREAQKRRLILNHDALVVAVSSVGDGFHPVQVVDWQGMTLRDQLQLAVNANAVVGMHGNGHVWNCLMPAGSAMVEVSSDVASRNEVGVGRNVRNVGNLAGMCPHESLSLRASGVVNAFSKEASPSHVWKEVDVTVSQAQLVEIVAFLAEVQAKARGVSSGA